MYRKPIITLVDEMMEGVYAESGSNCWTGYIIPGQDYVDGDHLFRIDATHSNSVEHIYDNVTISLYFNHPITKLRSENGWTCNTNGNYATVTRVNHGNGYSSGDHVNFCIWASTGDEATTKSLICEIKGFVCGKQTNVQGGGADGN